MFRYFIAVFVALTAVTALADDVGTVASSPSIAPDSRVFELRTYHAAPGKLEALHARFRNHTNQIFRKHGMEMIGYWVPMNKKGEFENTLIYILAYPSLAAREKAWKDFSADPEWRAAQAQSEKNGRLVEKVDSVFMAPTDYSPLK